MYPLVRTLYTTPAMNTHSKKCFIRENIQTPPPNHMDDNYYLYTLPSQHQEHGQIAILDAKITNYDLMHYLPMLTVNRRDKRKSNVRRKKLERCRERTLVLPWFKPMFFWKNGIVTLGKLAKIMRIFVEIECIKSWGVIFSFNIIRHLFPMLWSSHELGLKFG